MHEKKRLNPVFFSIMALFVLVIASDIVLYNKLTTDYNNKILAMNQMIVGAKNELIDEISKEKEFSARQRELLENKTLANFVKLQDYFSSETSKLKLDLQTVKTETESGLEDITQKVGGLEEKSLELEEMISDIDVRSSDFSAIVEDVVKAVVSIKTNKGQASGVIFNKNGYIMTNKHVIDGAASVYAVDYNSQSYNVQLVGTASNVDLAVLKIQSDKTFSYLNFADSSDIKVGERVIAIGNPLGLSFSVTEGIISAVNRVIDSTNIPYVQTDVPINAGNSGGPLVNSRKEIVGINTFKIVDTEGIGFAIPSNIAEDIAEQAVG